MGDSQVLVVPRQQDVRAELNRLLGSAVFRSSKRCRDFLRHIVEQTLNGDRGSLKERSIGIDLFSLPQNFDTSQHTIVRVTASETRKKLALYYHSETGTPHGVRIDVPPGAYNAEFTWNEEPEAKPLVDPMIVPEPRRISRRWLVAAGGSVGVLAAAGSVWSWRKSGSGNPRPIPAVMPDPTPAVGAQPSANVRIAIGAANPYIDRNGQTWGADRLFSGGSVLRRPSERIMRTLDPDLYRRLRTGDFRYDIPLPQGNYQLHLHFAETGLSDFISAESSGEGQRVFRVTANGKMLLDFFDVVADADGANVADERVFRNISPADDGLLHLAFSPVRGSAMVSGIEVRPVSSGKVLPLRIRSGWPSSWQDAAGGQWRGDSYFLGGNALVRRSNPAQGSEQASPDDVLYASERWGHFSYALPVSAGRYRVTLKFCEGHHGPRNTGVGGVGSRLFDVHCNGVALLKDFDIMREAGGEGRPLDRVFPKIRPNAQGKIVLSFVPNKGMACVNGIEVVDEEG